jgi:hypothetical protein
MSIPVHLVTLLVMVALELEMVIAKLVVLQELNIFYMQHHKNVS